MKFKLSSFLNKYKKVTVSGTIQITTNNIKEFFSYQEEIFEKVDKEAKNLKSAYRNIGFKVKKGVSFIEVSIFSYKKLRNVEHFADELKCNIERFIKSIYSSEHVDLILHLNLEEIGLLESKKYIYLNKRELVNYKITSSNYRYNYKSRY